MSGKVSVYAPIVLSDLTAVRDGAPPEPIVVHFSDLPEDEFDADDIEQAQLDALYDAAAASLEKLTERPGSTPLRAVVAGRVSADAPELQDDGSYVIAALPWSAVTAIYVDELSAARDVETIIKAVQSGREPNEDQYEAVENRLMLWHDPSEIGNLIEAYGG